MITKVLISRRVILILWISCLLLGCSVSQNSFPSNTLEPAEINLTPVEKTPQLSPTLTETIQGLETPTITLTEAAYRPLSFRAVECSYGGLFKVVEAVDRYTVRFTLCSPEPAFLAKIAFPTFGIQPQEWIEQTNGGGQGSMLLEHPIGTGPYVISQWNPGIDIVLEAFGEYWGERKPAISTLVFRWDTSASQRFLELQVGTVDGIDNVDAHDFAPLQADPSLQLLIRPALSVFYLGMNNDGAPFNDLRVRQAIALAIDRQEIVDTYLPLGYEVASYFAPCSIPMACEGEPWYAFDPIRAKELLAEAGFPDGFRTEIAYRDVVRGYLPNPTPVAQEIQSQLRKNLNIDIKLQPYADDDFFDLLDAGQLSGMYLLGWGADYPDISNFLENHFGSKASSQFGNKFEDILSALEFGAKSADNVLRSPYYEMANNAIREHVPVVPISHGGWAFAETQVVAYRKDVQGAHASPIGVEDFSLLSISGQDIFVWMQSAEPMSLYCADETDSESWRVCSQITETLYRYEPGTVLVQPGLAKICQPNADLSIWECNLQTSVKFHDGSELDANDVVMSFVVQWDAANRLHAGNSGEFSYFKTLWGNFLNSPLP